MCVVGGSGQGGRDFCVVHPFLSVISVCDGMAPSFFISLVSKTPGWLLPRSALQLRMVSGKFQHKFLFVSLKKTHVCSPALKVNRRLNSPNGVCQE